MKKEAYLGIVLALLLASLLSIAFHIRSARATTITVPDNYPTIQQAVNAAASGDTIVVKSGTYVENVLIANKSISLIGSGASTTTIKGVYLHH